MSNCFLLDKHSVINSLCSLDLKDRFPSPAVSYRFTIEPVYGFVFKQYVPSRFTLEMLCQPCETEFSIRQYLCLKTGDAILRLVKYTVH